MSKWTGTKWVDEDEDAGGGIGDIDLGGMDFSSFGNMGDMGDGGMANFEDDEEQEVEKPAEEDTDKAEGDAKLEETSEKKNMYRAHDFMSAEDI
ncbi:co-chaperone protein p23-1-like [Hibiscus syriacus]|uniref:co-chaperone protein p23-1-like n=1 Tax=Hibiscus syriacus TaxID=106335 RepID=UPI001923C305|nr:co-chaperone protein p23-1-like [Hibiscus syriacus]